MALSILEGITRQDEFVGSNPCLPAKPERTSFRLSRRLAVLETYDG